MKMYVSPGNCRIVSICTALVTLAASHIALAVADGPSAEVEKAAVLARTGKVKEAKGILVPLLKEKSTASAAGCELGLIYYEGDESSKALPYFKDALAATLSKPTPARTEKALTALLDKEADAAQVRYELGLIYESAGKTEKAAALFRDALATISSKGGTYIGLKRCRKCHFKQWKSWKKTDMAKALETLKPGVKKEEKLKLKLDPQKDYTKDAECLACHTTGFGLPGGYKIPASDKDKKRAKNNAGVTCEGCHGPGSKYVVVNEDINKKKRKYTSQELYDVGQYKVGVRSCTPCHNRRNPAGGAGYHFDYEESKGKDTHENFELKYRIKAD